MDWRTSHLGGICLPCLRFFIFPARDARFRDYADEDRFSDILFTTKDTKEGTKDPLREAQNHFHATKPQDTTSSPWLSCRKFPKNSALRAWSLAIAVDLRASFACFVFFVVNAAEQQPRNPGAISAPCAQIG